MRLTFKLEGEQAVRDLLAGLGQRARDLRPAWLGRVRPYVLDQLQRQFETEGANFGTPWAPLRPLTLKLRARAGHGRGGIEEDTSRLRQAFTLLGPEHIENVTPGEFELGANVPYAVAQGKGWLLSSIFGRPVSPRQVPARPVVPELLPQWFTDAVGQDVLDYIVTGDA